MSTPAIRAKRAPPRPSRVDPVLPLALLVFRVFANDANDAFSAYHLAFRAYLPDRRPDFHRILLLLRSVYDPAPRQVVRRQLHRDAVARQDLDEMHPHLSRYVGEHFHLVVELHPKHGVGERLDDRPLDLDRFFLRHVLLFSASLSPSGKAPG